MASLESEEQQECHHQAEKTHGLGQGESQNGVGEELLLEGGVPGVADDEGAEDGADAGAGPGHADGGGAGADELGGGVDVVLGGAGLEGAGVDCGRRPGSLKSKSQVKLSLEEGSVQVKSAEQKWF